MSYTIDGKYINIKNNLVEGFEDSCPQGPQGATGPVGPIGEKGIDGNQGPQGDDGPAGSIGPAADKLCIDDVCLTPDQFQYFLDMYELSKNYKLSNIDTSVDDTLGSATNPISIFGTSSSTTPNNNTVEAFMSDYTRKSIPAGSVSKDGSSSTIDSESASNMIIKEGFKETPDQLDLLEENNYIYYKNSEILGFEDNYERRSRRFSKAIDVCNSKPNCKGFVRKWGVMPGGKQHTWLLLNDENPDFTGQRDSTFQYNTFIKSDYESDFPYVDYSATAATGSTSSTAATGSTSSTATTGSTSSTAATGSTSSTATTGSTSFTATTGSPTCITGDEGPIGIEGPIGPDGPPGEPGSKGQDGISGLPGLPPDPSTDICADGLCLEKKHLQHFIELYNFNKT